jgi:hypothetical protein
MKTTFLLSLLVLTTTLRAEDTQTSRTLVRVGLLLTKGDDTGWNHLGPGFTLDTLTYFDPSSPDGWYYGVLGSAFAREAGGVVLADTRLVTLGWRGDPGTWFGNPGLPFQLDAGLAPTIGSRIQGSTVLGNGYAGLGVTLGLGFSIFEGQDLGLSWEPVFPLAAWGGEVHAPNRGYSDFVLSWTFKSFVETRKLKW